MKKQFLLNFDEMNFIQYYMIELFCNFILLMLFYDSIFQHNVLFLDLKFEELADIFTFLIKMNLMYVMNILKSDCIMKSLF